MDSTARKELRRFEIVDPDVDFTPLYTVWSEEDVRKVYYPYWEKEMLRLGRGDKVSFENCLEDWIIVNWATELHGEA